MDIQLIINSADPDPLERLRLITTELRSRGNHIQAGITFESGDATRLAREAVERGVDLVVCAGGDGTLNEIVNGILPPPGTPSTSKLPRLGIVPLGTGNDFAAFMEIPTDIDEAYEFAAKGPEILTDVALLNGRYFLNVSSGGLGAAATEETSARAKRLLGSAAYLVTGARSFASLEPSHARFIADGACLFDGPFLFFAVGNGGRAGGGTWITPRADPADGLLDLCIAENMGRAELLRLLPEVRAGEHLNSEHVIYRRVSKLRIEPNGDLSVNVDGEPIPSSILEYSVEPGVLRLVANAR